MPEQRGKLSPLGAGVTLNMEFGIDLVHILLDAALGEVELFRDLTVGKPLPHQLHDLVFPRRQRAQTAGRTLAMLRACAASPSAMICAARGDCVSRASRGFI